MKPRRATTLRWTLTAATVALATIWLVSGWLRASVAITNSCIVAVAHGGIYLEECGSSLAHEEMKPQVGSNYDYNMLWRTYEVFSTRPGWSLRAYPLWPAVAALLTPTTILWLLHLRATRRTDRCPTCHYPRTGLTPTSPCPECGTPPTPESAP